MPISLRTSSSTAGGSPTAVSLGGRPSNAAPSTALNGFFDAVTQAQNDAGHTDYRCVFVYNNGSTVMNNVRVSVDNTGGRSTATAALSSTATNTFASYNTATIANDTTAPSVSGGYISEVTIGTLNPGQVKAIWVKRVTPAKVDGGEDAIALYVSALEVIV